MRDGWIKHFVDGSTETGLDNEVAAHKASWQKGRLDGLCGVELFCGKFGAKLTAGEGEWWQADTMISRFVGVNKVGQRVMLSRRVQKKITDQDVGKHINMALHKGNFLTFDLTNQQSKYKTNIIIKREHISKWLTLSFNVDKQVFEISIKDKR